MTKTLRIRECLLDYRSFFNCHYSASRSQGYRELDFLRLSGTFDTLLKIAIFICRGEGISWATDGEVLHTLVQCLGVVVMSDGDLEVHYASPDPGWPHPT
jgi:hypothetical protein